VGTIALNRIERGKGREGGREGGRERERERARERERDYWEAAPAVICDVIDE